MNCASVSAFSVAVTSAPCAVVPLKKKKKNSRTSNHILGTVGWMAADSATDAARSGRQSGPLSDCS